MTISAVGEKITALSVLRLREEIKLSTSRVLKNCCIKLLFQEQRFLNLGVLPSDSRTVGTVPMLIKKTKIILAVRDLSVFLQLWAIFRTNFEEKNN